MHPTLTLPRDLTIYSVGEQRPLMLDWLAQSPSHGPCHGPTHGTPTPAPDSDWTLHAECVDEVDAAGLQLLQSLARTLAREQQTLHLQAPSAALVSACHSMGLSALLGAATSAATGVAT
jgi:hypothetical protein